MTSDADRLSKSYRVHACGAVRTPRQRPPRMRDAAQPVTTTRVNRGIWEVALKAAKGDPRRIRIISDTKVEIDTTGASQ